MKDEKKVSIIIPTYNVEKYVYRAIESVLFQTYSNVEVIIIDDGSTDNTWKIIKEYENEYKKIKAFRQENKGVSFARNEGLKRATGDYVLFLDSDDWLELNAVSKLIQLSEIYPHSLICVDRYFAYFDKEGQIYKEKQNINLQPETVHEIDTLRSFVNHKFNLQSACYKMFEMNLIKDNHLLFDTKLHHGEDGFFVFEYINKIKTIHYSNDALWNILERPGSATKSEFNKKMLTAIIAIEQMINYPNIPSEIKIDLHTYLVERALMIKNKLIHSKEYDNDSYKFVNATLKKNKKMYLKSDTSTKRKIYYLLMLYLPSSILKNIF